MKTVVSSFISQLKKIIIKIPNNIHITDVKRYEMKQNMFHENI